MALYYFKKVDYDDVIGPCSFKTIKNVLFTENLEYAEYQNNIDSKFKKLNIDKAIKILSEDHRERKFIICQKCQKENEFIVEEIRNKNKIKCNLCSNKLKW